MKSRALAVPVIAAFIVMCLSGCPSPELPGGPMETVAAPIFSPAAGAYGSDQDVALSCSTDGAVIHYTTDGTIPTAASPVYSSEISVNGPLAMRMIKACAVKSGMNDSAVGQAYYTVEYPSANKLDIPGGLLTSNLTLTKSGGPYLILGDLTVPAGITLTIGAGTVVQFPSTDSMAGGQDSDRVELIVRGTLSVNGSRTDPAIFRANAGTSANVWYGIVVDTGTADIAGAIIKHAAFGIRAIHAASDLHAADCIIQTCGYGLNLMGSPSIDAVIILDCGMHGILVAGGATGSITNTIIRNSANCGIFMNIASSSASLSITNCTLYGNGDSGISAAAQSGASLTVNVLNCIVTGNGQYGVLRNASPGTVTVNVSYSDAWDNDLGNYGDVTAGTGCKSEDPLYADGSTDLSLQAGSPCIDAGFDVDAPTHDRNNVSRPRNGGHGELFDMGAYER